MYNEDGFNKRTNYIQNSNNERIKHFTSADNSFAQMKVQENKPDVKTYNVSNSEYIEEPNGNRENFVLRNYNLNHVNQKANPNSTLLRNKFRKF